MIRNGTQDNYSYDNVQDLGTIDYVKDGDIYTGATCVAVLVTSSSDLDLLGNYPPGSFAMTAGFTNLWQKGADGEFVQIIGE